MNLQGYISCHLLKDHTGDHVYLSLIYSIFIHVTLLTIISQRIKPYFSFPDILQNLLIFQNQYSSDTPTLKINVSPANSYAASHSRLNLLINVGLLLGLYSLVETYIHSMLFIVL
ncbi:hypothetical protein LDENG_00121250, partial [Lucifuga dentata]